MKTAYRKVKAKVERELEEAGFTTFKNPEHPDIVSISDENEDEMAIAYYEGMWVNPKINLIAQANGLHVEWFNPGSIGLVPN